MMEQEAIQRLRLLYQQGYASYGNEIAKGRRMARYVQWRAQELRAVTDWRKQQVSTARAERRHRGL